MKRESASFGLTSNVFQMSNIVFCYCFYVAVNWPWRVSRGAEKKRTGGDRQRRGGNMNSLAMERGGGIVCNIITYLVDMELHRPLNHTILYAVSKHISLRYWPSMRRAIQAEN